MQELKVIARLMDYPSEEVHRHAADLKVVLQESTALDAQLMGQFNDWLDSYAATDLMDLQETYGGLFDRGRATSLLLFEHVHGESRDRGQAMVDLMALYQSHGLDIDARELPDYIPLYLEYLSSRPREEAENGLLDVAHILALVGARLEDRGSQYSLLFRALLQLCEADISVDEFLEKAAAEERDDSLEALDKIWEEEAVRFGTGDDSASNTQGDAVQIATDHQKVTPVHFVENSAAAATPAH